MEFILAQIFGAISLILICIGYFLKKKSQFLIIQIVANIFYAGAFVVVGAFVGAGLTMISTLRCVYIYVAEKKEFKYKLHLLPIFVVTYIVTTIIFWQSPYDLMPLLTSTMFTIGFAFKDLQKMRYFLLMPNIILVVYNVLVSTYTSALLDALEVVIIIVAIIRYHYMSKKSTTTIEGN